MLYDNFTYIQAGQNNIKDNNSKLANGHIPSTGKLETI